LSFVDGSLLSSHGVLKRDPSGRRSTPRLKHQQGHLAPVKFSPRLSWCKVGTYLEPYTYPLVLATAPIFSDLPIRSPWIAGSLHSGLTVSAPRAASASKLEGCGKLSTAHSETRCAPPTSQSQSSPRQTQASLGWAGCGVAGLHIANAASTVDGSFSGRSTAYVDTCAARIFAPSATCLASRLTTYSGTSILMIA
jgi:hypothetical protein